MLAPRRIAVHAALVLMALVIPAPAAWADGKTKPATPAAPTTPSTPTTPTAPSSPAKSEPKLEKKSEKKAAIEPPAESSVAPTQARGEPLEGVPPWTHPAGYSAGLAIEMGAARSRAFRLEYGIRLVMDIGLTERTYLHFDPGFSTFKRSTSVTAPSRIDVPVDPAQSTVVTLDTITNDVRLLQFSTRAQIGYDFAEGRVTTRVGGLIGLTTAKTPAAQCQPGSASSVPSGSSGSSDTVSKGDVRQSGVMAGAAITPIAIRLGESRRFEIGTYVDIESVVVPICDYPRVDSVTVKRGSPVGFEPGVTGPRVFAMAFGLQAGTVFW